MRSLISLLVLASVTAASPAQTQDVATWAVKVAHDYRVVPDVTYLIADATRQSWI